MPCGATRGSTGVGQEAEEAGAKRGPQPSVWFPGEEMAKAQWASLSKCRAE